MRGCVALWLNLFNLGKVASFGVWSFHLEMLCPFIQAVLDLLITCVQLGHRYVHVFAVIVDESSLFFYSKRLVLALWHQAKCPCPFKYVKFF